MPVKLKYEDGRETDRLTAADYVLEGGLKGRAFRERQPNARVFIVTGIDGKNLELEEHVCDDLNGHGYEVRPQLRDLGFMVQGTYFEATSEEIAAVKNGEKRLPRLTESKEFVLS